jgi:hypothetical protein
MRTSLSLIAKCTTAPRLEGRAAARAGLWSCRFGSAGRLGTAPSPPPRLCVKSVFSSTVATGHPVHEEARGRCGRRCPGSTPAAAPRAAGSPRSAAITVALRVVLRQAPGSWRVVPAARHREAAPQHVATVPRRRLASNAFARRSSTALGRRVRAAAVQLRSSFSQASGWLVAGTRPMHVLRVERPGAVVVPIDSPTQPATSLPAARRCGARARTRGGSSCGQAPFFGRHHSLGAQCGGTVEKQLPGLMP